MALLSMVLLLAVPTAGRIASAGADAAQGVGTGFGAVCTAMGLRPSSPALADAGTPAPHPAPAMPHPGFDCEYCPLLAAAVMLALAPAFAPWGFGRPPAPPSAAAARRLAFLHPCGLGSRGPPVPL